jgi:hypothetical protein
MRFCCWTQRHPVRQSDAKLGTTIGWFTMEVHIVFWNTVEMFYCSDKETNEKPRGWVLWVCVTLRTSLKVIGSFHKWKCVNMRTWVDVGMRIPFQSQIPLILGTTIWWPYRSVSIQFPTGASYMSTGYGTPKDRAMLIWWQELYYSNCIYSIYGVQQTALHQRWVFMQFKSFLWSQKHLEHLKESIIFKLVSVSRIVQYAIKIFISHFS